MSASRAPTDHADLLCHVTAPKAEKPVDYEKPDWMEHHQEGPPPKGAVPPKTPRRALELLAHNAHTPSMGDLEHRPAPFLEDGVSVWERDGTAKKKRKMADGGEEEEEEDKEDDDPRWNVKRRSPVKKLEGEFEKDFRSRDSYTGNHKPEEDEEEEEKEEEKEKEEGGKKEEEKEKKDARNNEEETRKEDKRKVKVPDHLRCDPVWSHK